MSVTRESSAQLSTLQYVRFKGSISPIELSDAVGISPATIEAAPWAEWLLIDVDRVRLSPAGRAHLDALLSKERAEVDLTTLGSYYRSEFLPINGLLKGAVTEWQIRPDGQLNDHSDPAYDADVVQQIEVMVERHQASGDWLGLLVPRLVVYSDRLEHALHEVRRGDRSYLLRPLMDSIHTVWFELHQELLDLLGIDRASEEA